MLLYKRLGRFHPHIYFEIVVSVRYRRKEQIGIMSSDVNSFLSRNASESQLIGARNTKEERVPTQLK